MGNMCYSEHKYDSQPNKVRRIVSMKKQSQFNQADCSQSRIILQSLRAQKVNGLLDDQLTDFQIISELGKGGQADVFQIKFEASFISQRKTLIKDDDTYALKRIYKNNSLNRRESLQLSKKVLTKIDCPFIINGLLLCEDENYHYQVMPNAKGGDAASFLHGKTSKVADFRKVGEQGIKFILAGVVLALQQLHNNNIIYCDLKLENILIGADGYPLLTDFEMSYGGKHMKTDNYMGTRTYAAPEVLLDNYVNKSVDIWALGVVLYALTYGQTPYAFNQIKDVQYILKCENNQGKYKQKNKKVSNQLNNLINSLLCFKPSDRLGYCSLGQIRGHSFFRNFDWDNYRKKNMVSPLKIIVEKYDKQRNQEVRRKKQQALLKSQAKTRRKISADRQTACDQFAARLQQFEEMEVRA